jgi:hypothetical protein
LAALAFAIDTPGLRLPEKLKHQQTPSKPNIGDINCRRDVIRFEMCEFSVSQASLSKKM